VESPRDVASLPDLLATLMASEDAANGYERLCELEHRNDLDFDCEERGPWMYVEEDDVSLIVPLSGGRHGRLRGLARSVDGREDNSKVTALVVRGSNPVDTWLEVHVGEGYCEDTEDPDEWMCGLRQTNRDHIVVTGLPDGRFLVTVVSIDVLQARGAEDLYDPARVRVGATKLDVWACDGHARIDLPDGVAEMLAVEQNSHADVEPKRPYASADEIEQAAGRCNKGWSRLQAGEIEAARIDIDAALAVLEHAEAGSGRRSFGACLYNRGRIAEANGELVDAAELYRRSLIVRPNDTVAARLGALGE
jgi:hypothetical protein